ncbi:uncharacterized protein LOC143301024 [Babylonia areolata]|uniref:uncharacterized protein LOC143301024 n=1 Tax=Babylonia areolata TaxID=304850 RepID=UPI003FD0F25C
MGRRKRKGNPRKRSLAFEESPVENPRHPLSPVPCADNPVTALTVPVDSHCTIPWVSPQFGGVALSVEKRRQTRQRRNISRNHGDRSTKENPGTGTHGHGSRSKFPALRFVGDESTSQRKPAPKAAGCGELSEPVENKRLSHVSVSEEKRHLSHVSEEKRRLCHVSEEKRRLSHFEEGSSKRGDRRAARSSHVSGEEDYGCAESVRRRRSSRQSVGFRHRLSLALGSLDWSRQSLSPDSSMDQPAPSDRTKRPQEPSQNFTALRSEGNSFHCEDENSHIISDEQGVKGKKGYNSGILSSPLDTSSASPSSSNTPLTARVAPIPLRVALFAPSPSDDAVDLSLNRRASQLPRCEDDRWAGSVSSTRSSSTPRTARSPAGGGSLEGDRPRRSRRLQGKVREAMRYLQPASPGKRGCGKILVSDTPETEYSLTFRQRQRLKRKQLTCKQK